MMALVFIGSLALLAFSYAGYPLAMRWLARWRPRPPDLAGASASARPAVTFLIVARNEESRIADRLRNLASCRHNGPRQYIVVCDGCQDGTEQAAHTAIQQPVDVVAQPALGKAAALNAGIARATGEIVIFGDARQHFAPDAVEELLRPFGDPSVVAVSGSLDIAPSAEGVGRGLDSYWRLEKRLRLDESRTGSCVGCTGAIYAIRRQAHQAIPPDTILDDVLIPMHAAAHGGRVIFAPKATAWDPQPLGSTKEAGRKERTLAGNFQLLFRHPAWLLPWGHPLWCRLICHKYLRLTGPLLLAVAFLSNLWLARHSLPWRVVLLTQILGYVSLLIASIVPALRRLKPFALGHSFLFLQFRILRALATYLLRTTSLEKGWK